MAKDLQW